MNRRSSPKRSWRWRLVSPIIPTFLPIASQLSCSAHQVSYPASHLSQPTSLLSYPASYCPSQHPFCPTQRPNYPAQHSNFPTWYPGLTVQPRHVTVRLWHPKLRPLLQLLEGGRDLPKSFLLTYSIKKGTPESFILRFSTRKMNTVVFSEGGLKVGSSSMKPLTFDNLFPPQRHSCLNSH